jgi:ABC-type Fe3+-siderophore transport system permease subunit
VRRSPNFLLMVFAVLLAICLVAVVFGQVHYATAEKAYEAHLQRVVFSPHADIKHELEHYAQAADKWLRIRTAASALATMAILGIVVQIMRRRNERITSHAEVS